MKLHRNDKNKGNYQVLSIHCNIVTQNPTYHCDNAQTTQIDFFVFISYSSKYQTQ